MIININKQNPQERLIKQVVQVIEDGGVAIIPTDSIFALACSIHYKNAVEKVRTLRNFEKNHNLTLMCADLSQLSTFAKVDNLQFKILKHNLPGAFTFILEASKETPKILHNEKRKTIGLRVPNHPITQAILKALNAPLLTASLILDGQVINSVDDMASIEKRVDIIIDSEENLWTASTIVDLTNGIEIVRQGDATLK
jgi:tRNA threonylcarbamoyl adenosine modification protein (Sua5/YciO/YrdC/YwlC family)